MIVRTNNGHSGTIMLDNNASINAHGYAMRPGTFVGAFGCVSPNGVFHASEVTLAANQSLYSQTITGVVQRKSGDTLIVTEPARRTTGVWYVPDIDDFRVGQTVTGIGMMGGNGEFYPQSINGASTAFAPERSEQMPRRASITLTGVVKRVERGAIIVWEPTRRTTGTWFIRDAGRFRVGERVVGTGTENRRGDFYPSTIQFQ
jgi:hypothetical protein